LTVFIWNKTQTGKTDYFWMANLRKNAVLAAGDTNTIKNQHSNV
jgi:hypothetical protein